jgi:general secretion pathway protein G
MRKLNCKGFTVVEMLIIVVVLGVVASIVIPQFTNADQIARENNLQATLENLRTEIQLYRMQHGNALPDLVNGWTVFTAPNPFGRASQNGDAYMQAAPTNPLNGKSNVIDGLVTKATEAGCGFVYDYQNGTGSGKIYATDSEGHKVAGTGSFGQDGFMAY